MHVDNQKNIYGYKKVPFELMTEVMEFALDNTYIRDLHGGLWKQVKGIPMGDPHSPGMTIAACGWMEDKWMQSLTPQIKAQFRAARYMDDILVIHTESIKKTFLEDSNCYQEPLSLEDGTQNTFLETTFDITEDGDYAFWLKNINIPGQPTQVWRYAHYNSYGTPQSKIRVAKATLQKVWNMASNPDVLTSSALQKIYEFQQLQYPPRIIWQLCNFMAVRTRDPTWFRIRSSCVSKENKKGEI